MLTENKINIIGLNETRLNQTINDLEIQIGGYQTFRNDRKIDGGGKAFYLKDSFTDVKVKLKCDELELLCLEITPRNAKSTLLYYEAGRPPTPDTDKIAFVSFREILRQLVRKDMEIILCGDTNCDFKDPKNYNTKLFKQLYNEYQLEQLTKDHTRVAVRTTKDNEHHTSKTLIDIYHIISYHKCLGTMPYQLLQSIIKN